MGTMTLTKPKFTPGELGTALKKAVNKDFVERGKEKTGDWRLFVKATILLLMFFGSYYLIIFSHLSGWTKAALIAPLVFSATGIGFSIMHDANHGSFSKHGWVNTVMGLTLDMLGPSSLLWKTKHNIIHHPFVNINGIDDDIEAKPFFRLHDDQPWLPRHRNQYKTWYWVPAYGGLYFAWVWYKDFQKYFAKKVFNEPITLTFWNHVSFWISKVVHFTAFVIIPIAHLGWWWIPGYFLFGLLVGLIISTVFQLAHIVEGVRHASVESANNTESVAHQIDETADFAVNNRFVTWWVGGLNFQIEHHLFYKISHVHYPRIHKTIEPICEQAGKKLLVFPTVRVAVRSHVAELKRLSKKPLDS